MSLLEYSKTGIFKNSYSTFIPPQHDCFSLDADDSDLNEDRSTGKTVLFEKK